MIEGHHRPCVGLLQSWSTLHFGSAPHKNTRESVHLETDSTQCILGLDDVMNVVGSQPQLIQCFFWVEKYSIITDLIWYKINSLEKLSCLELWHSYDIHSIRYMYAFHAHKSPFYPEFPRTTGRPWQILVQIRPRHQWIWRRRVLEKVLRPLQKLWVVWSQFVFFDIPIWILHQGFFVVYNW